MTLCVGLFYDKIYYPGINIIQDEKASHVDCLVDNYLVSKGRELED